MNEIIRKDFEIKSEYSILLQAGSKPEIVYFRPENVQFPVLWYNLAVVCYHQKRYFEALVIPDKLSKTFSNVISMSAKHSYINYKLQSM